MKKVKIVVAFFAFVSMSALSQTKKWTLEECITHALVNNNSVKQALLDQETVKISKLDALGAFLPTVGARASHSWNIGLNTNITTGLLENQTSQFTSGGINVGLDVFKGLQNQKQLSKSRLSTIASEYQLAKIKEDVSLNVANAYLQILFNKEQLKVQTDQLTFDTKKSSRAKELVQAGVLPKGDLLDIEAAIATDKQKVVAAENALLISKLSLAQLLQIQEYELFDINDASIEVTKSTVLAETPKDIIYRAKQHRVAIKLAQANLNIAEQDINLARGAYQPTLQAFYSLDTRVSHGVLGKAVPFWDQVDINKGHSFGVQLNVPILNGFATRNNVSRAKIAFQKSKLALEQQELDFERTIYTAYTDTQGAEKAYESASVTLEARQKAMEYAKERYEVGLMNVFDYNQAQTLFANAQSEALRTKYDYLFRTKILEFYFGIPLTK